MPPRIFRKRITEDPSGLSHRLQEQQTEACRQNDGYSQGADRNQSHDAPEHDVDEVVATRKKIHGLQYALGRLGLQWVGMHWYVGLRGVGSPVGFVSSAHHLSSNAGEVTRLEVEEMAHLTHQRLLVGR